MKKLGLASLLFTLSGCISLASATSGQIGCPSEDIVVTNEETGWNTKTWTAQCHARTYFCSATSGGREVQVACKEADDPQAAKGGAPPDAPTGCQFDTQCKGDRICRAGACVDPPPKAAASGQGATP